MEKCADPACMDTPDVLSVLVSRAPSRAEVGRAAWQYVHARAETYDPRCQVSELEWLEAFVCLYPCKHCASDFLKICSIHPPKLHSKKDYIDWWFEVHNEVNKQIGK